MLNKTNNYTGKCITMQNEFMIEHLDVIIVLVINVIALTGSYYKLRSRIERAEEDLHDIEITRLNNVKILREIYDSKIADARAHATNLFKIRDGELKELAHRMGALELKFDRQSELITGKFTELMKSVAIIETHIKTCTFVQNKR